MRIAYPERMGTEVISIQNGGRSNEHASGYNGNDVIGPSLVRHNYILVFPLRLLQND